MIYSQQVKDAIKSAKGYKSENKDFKGENIGAMKDFLAEVGAVKWSPIKTIKSGSTLIITEDKNGDNLFLFLSRSLAAKHQDKPFTREDLLNNPVWMTPMDNGGNKFSIGEEGSGLPELETIDFAALKLELA